MVKAVPYEDLPASEFRDMAAEIAREEPIFQFFAFHHLPPELQQVSATFCNLAGAIIRHIPRNPERTVALRRLLEAKDAAVRSVLYKDHR